jgi:hypothetical protein
LYRFYGFIQFPTESNILVSEIRLTRKALSPFILHYPGDNLFLFKRRAYSFGQQRADDPNWEATPWTPEHAATPWVELRRIKITWLQYAILFHALNANPDVWFRHRSQNACQSEILK